MIKNTILFLMVLLPIAIAAQQANYTIMGKIGNINSQDTIILRYIKRGQNYKVPVKLNNGNFIFKGLIETPTLGTLELIHAKHKDDYNKDLLTIYLIKGKTYVSAFDSISKATIKGTRFNEELQEYLSQIKVILKKFEDSDPESEKASEEKQKSSLPLFYKAFAENHPARWLA